MPSALLEPEIGKAAPMPKNILVVYEGGGYDGCIWEWNAFMFQCHGGFRDIYSSGHRGIDTKEGALEFLQDEGRQSGAHAEIIDLKDPKATMKFTTEHCATIVLATLRAASMEKGISMSWKCGCCGDIRSHQCAANPEDFRCAGGITILPNMLICDSCECSHSCIYCGEFWEDNESFVNGYCEYCGKDRCTACEGEFKNPEELEDGQCSVCRSIEIPNPDQLDLPFDG